MRRPPIPPPSTAFGRRFGWPALGAAALLSACAAPGVSVEPAAPLAEFNAASTLAVPSLVSEALTPRDYRQDGAKHLYGKNSNRIFKGKMPPHMHAVGVLQVDIDGAGQVRRLHWIRAPKHAPDVVREIERTIYAAAPFPAPVRLGSVTYTDVWLWDKGGSFQLDTLTEGQRSE